MPLASRSRYLTFLLAAIVLAAGAAPSSATGVLIPEVDRVDALYDGSRDLVYISTTRGELVRYDVQSDSFLAPLSLSTSGLVGLSMSPDGSKLAVADSSVAGGGTTIGTNSVHVVDLDSWTSRRLDFPRSFSEAGTFMVEFIDDATLAVSSQFSGSGWVPLRRVDLTNGISQQIANVRQNTMLSMTADHSALFYAESNISSGEFGRYDPFAGSFRESGTGWFAFEIAANRDGTQFAVPSYNGMYVYDENFQEIDRIGVYARTSPIGLAYHPTDDVVYLAWWGTNEAVQAYDTNTLTPLGVIDDAMTLSWRGNFAFGQGRLRISSDAGGLTVTASGGVKLYAPIAFIDDDPDDDGVPNRSDNCPNTANADQQDTDSNGRGDACNDSSDRDGDEWEDALDLCPDVADPLQLDTDSNRVGDACNDFEDLDGDEWADALDNCPNIGNDQTDTDGDRLGDVCDPFPDRADHILAQCEGDRDTAQLRVAELEAELGACLSPLDGDHDGVLDDRDACPNTEAGADVDDAGCSRAQFCASISIDESHPKDGRWECNHASWTRSGATRPPRNICRIRWQRGLVCRAR